MMLQWTWKCRYLFKLGSLVPSDKCPEVELLDHMVVLFLIFWGTSILFSILVVSVHFPTMSAQWFSFLHIHASICYLLSFWQQPFWQVWGSISLWFWFSFPWLAMLNLFFMYLLAVCMCSLRKSLLRSSAHLKIKVFIF